MSSSSYASTQPTRPPEQTSRPSLRLLLLSFLFHLDRERETTFFPSPPRDDYSSIALFCSTPQAPPTSLALSLPFFHSPLLLFFLSCSQSPSLSLAVCVFLPLLLSLPLPQVFSHLSALALSRRSGQTSLTSQQPSKYAQGRARK